MGADQDIFVHMPEAPPSSPEVRDVAIKRALEQFDTNNIAGPKGFTRDTRLMRRTVLPSRPSHGRLVMPQKRRLVAASLLFLLVGSSTFLYVAPPNQFGRPTGEPQLASAPAKSPPPDRNRPARAPKVSEGNVQVAAPSPAPAPPVAPPLTYAPAKSPPSDRNRLAPAPTVGEANRQVATGSPAPAQPVAPPLTHAPVFKNGLDQADVRAYPPAGYQWSQDHILSPTEQIGRDQFAGASENPFRSYARLRSRPSRSMSTRRPIRSCAPRSIATSCPRRPRYGPRSSSITSPMHTRAGLGDRTVPHLGIDLPGPWSEGRKIIRIGIKGYAVQPVSRPRATSCS